MTDLLAQVAQLREAYHKVRRALPWLDGSVWEDDPPAFGEFARPLPTPFVKAAVATRALKGRVDRLKKAQSVRLLRCRPPKGDSLASLEPLLTEMAACRMPLVVLHTNTPPDRLGEFAANHRDLTIILESGPRKILYVFEQVLELLATHPNVHLCTYNLCNWLALERLVAAGLGGRVLYGSHSPRYSPDAAMGPVVMGQFPWQVKCDVAGNNLRRLLGMPVDVPQEVPWQPPRPIVVDAHAHSVPAGGPAPFGLPTPDQHFQPADWVAFLDRTAVEQLYLMPAESLLDPTKAARDCCRDLLAHAPERFLYIATFHPTGDGNHLKMLRASLSDPSCVGIKIHPSLHGVPAEDKRFEPAFSMAELSGKPVVTHSWEASSYNPVQHLSQPDRFRGHLARHPGVRLVLGHAGGRPSTFEAVAAIARDFPNVSVDLAGDYYDNGIVDALAARLGAERVIFASDVDWIDPRCNLAPVLASSLPDDDVRRILRPNALRTYRGRSDRPAGTGGEPRCDGAS